MCPTDIMILQYNSKMIETLVNSRFDNRCNRTTGSHAPIKQRMPIIVLCFIFLWLWSLVVVLCCFENTVIKFVVPFARFYSSNGIRYFKASYAPNVPMILCTKLLLTHTLVYWYTVIIFSQTHTRTIEKVIHFQFFPHFWVTTLLASRYLPGHSFEITHLCQDFFGNKSWKSFLKV